MSAICGVLGGSPGTRPDMGAMLDALADYGAGRAEWSGGPVRLGRRCRRDADGGADRVGCVAWHRIHYARGDGNKRPVRR